MKRVFETNEIFVEQLKRVNYRRSHGGSLGDDQSFYEEKPGYFFLIILIIFAFLFLISRIFTLQVIGGRYYRNLADKNRALEYIIPAPRGVILDRNGEVLTRNIPLYRQRIDNSHFRIVSRDQALKLEVKGGSELASLDTIIGRQYPYKETTAHVIGYIGEATKEEIDNSMNYCLLDNNSGCRPYVLGDFTGKMGLEKKYENILRGISGKELIEADANGRKLRTLGRVDPVAGRDIKLSLDINLQKAAEQGMHEVVKNERSTAGSLIKGAVVVANPQNGEILALLSTPSFNPEVFIRYKGTDNSDADIKIDGLMNDKNLPLFDRVIGGTYPPGSTFKLVGATAGLESGKISQSTLFDDTGVIKIGTYEFPNWAFLKSGEKDGLINVVSAIKRSNDIYFYKLGETVGLSGLTDWAHKFGLGNILGIDLDGEAKGLVPSEKWKQDNISDNWYLGDTYHLAIGQGYLLVTPLQVNTWTNAIANGGQLCRPHLVPENNLKLENQNGNLIIENESYCRDLMIKKTTLDLIHEGMEAACSTGGTGWPLFDFTVKSSRSVEPKKIQLACKTGTAEFGDTEKRTHAWFTVYAPAEKPEISVTVLVEAGGEGSDVSTLVAKKVLEEWFKR